ncbi:hypothetical protein V6D40_07785 [Corynebacterium sp. Q4381]|uniref:hypothetical protein n=1 Tax=Corynebacterium sp. Marseille-Q4381 TaxID=3121597 RepID=UPI002FE606A9
MSKRASQAAAACLAASVALAATGCSVVNNVKTVGNALEGAASPATVTLGELLPPIQRAAIACPYSGEGVNELFGETVFRNEDLDDSVNWIVAKLERGALVKERLNRAEIDVCTSGESVREIGEDEPLRFEKADGSSTWVLAN